VLTAVRHGNTGTVVGASIFAATTVLLYLASTVYHALKPGRAKDAFCVLDHGAIYLLIAGTYTPFTLGALRGPWGWTLLALIWTMALAGVILKVSGRLRHMALSTSLYVAMGWLVIVAVRPLWQQVPAAGLVWLALGGLAYTAGVAFFVANRLRYGHFVWHLFVLAGTSCHFWAVMHYSA
jgi:hemolysin III